MKNLIKYWAALILFMPFITHADVTWYLPDGVDPESYIEEMSSVYYNSGCTHIPSGNIQPNGSMGVMCDLSQFLTPPIDMAGKQMYVDTSPNDHYTNPSVAAAPTTTPTAQTAPILIQGATGAIPAGTEGTTSISTSDQDQIAVLEQLIVELTQILQQLIAQHAIR
jgi:hypothetical protein